MRVAVLTSLPVGLASRCLPALCDSPVIDVAAVVYPVAPTSDRRAELRRIRRKVGKIGLAGAVNGLRIRRWYNDDGTDDIVDVASRHGVPVLRPPALNSPETQAAFRDLDLDLGLSLGNGYIRQEVFTIPRLGMLNVHMELLPEFRGALGVIWPIYEGHGWTGFTVHQINERLDAGRVLYREEMPIVFRASLRETVESNLAALRARLPDALRSTCENYADLGSPPATGGPRRYYTTPTFAEYRRMLRNHRRMAAQANREGITGVRQG